MNKWRRKGSVGTLGSNYGYVIARRKSSSGSLMFAHLENEARLSLRKASVGSVAFTTTEGDTDTNHRQEEVQSAALFSGLTVRLELEELKASLSAKREWSDPDRRLSVSHVGENDHTTNKIQSHTGLQLSLQKLSLKKDPRSWSREDVSTWLVETVRRNSLPQVNPQRFKMNGKGLSLLTMEMFSARAPCGGKTLFKLRLTEAIYDLEKIQDTGSSSNYV